MIARRAEARTVSHVWSTLCGIGLLGCQMPNVVNRALGGGCRNAANAQEAKANANTKLTTQQMQNLVCRSEVLEGRDIPHRAQPGKDAFVRKWTSVKRKHMASRHYAHKHKLSDQWKDIMLRKAWPAMDESVARKSSAAWSWLLAKAGQAHHHNFFSFCFLAIHLCFPM